jgi:hypothetical protein
MKTILNSIIKIMRTNMKKRKQYNKQYYDNNKQQRREYYIRHKDKFNKSTNQIALKETELCSTELPQCSGKKG